MPPAAPELITAVSHPLRRRIIRAYLDDGLESTSAEELAGLLGEPISRAAYHLKTLARCDILRLVQGENGSYRWALNVEPGWLRVVLDFWAESKTRR
jgi:DNA-binding transcriptional ArsR family regulator